MDKKVPVIVVGDANPDLIIGGNVIPRFGQTEILADSMELVEGGSAAIVAMGLARLDIPVGIVSAVGGDVFGEFMRSRLEARGVDTSCLIVRQEDRSGLSVILSRPEDRAIVTTMGAMSSLAGEHVLYALDRQRVAGHLHVAGYFLQPELAGALPAVLRKARESGWTTSLDTNWDPEEKWGGLPDVLPNVDIFLPNRAELRSIARALRFPESLDDHELAREMAGLGPRVVVKAGAEGGWSTGPDGVTVAVPAARVDVVDTIGAGDSFDAGYLAALSVGVADELERIRWAVAAGSLSTRGVGGTRCQASRHELVSSLGEEISAGR